MRCAVVLSLSLSLMPGAATVLAAAPSPGDRPAKDTKLGRSPVLARNGMIATSQPLASAAGLRVLMEGGNAVDAAIAAAAVLNVVEPMMCGIGGDLFALYHEAETGTLHGLNATGRAGSRADAARLRADGLTRMPGNGPLVVTVPGPVEAGGVPARPPPGDRRRVSGGR